MRRVLLPLGRRLSSVCGRYCWPGGPSRMLPGGEVRNEFPSSRPRSAADTPAGLAARGAALARLEAVLFLAREPISSRKLAQLANLADGTQARTLVRKLREAYDLRGSAFSVEEVAGGFQLFTRRKFARWLRRLEQFPSEIRLSHPSLETLAVVAYRQPVLRADIEAIRGVQSGEILRQLMDRDLVRIVGRAEELGRPFLYGTTRRFLQVFGLRHLEELPRAAELRSAEITLPQAVAFQGNQSDDIPASNNSGSEPQEGKVVSTDMLCEEEKLLLDARRPIVAAKDDDDDDYDDDDEDEDDDDDDEDMDDDLEDEDLDDDDLDDDLDEDEDEDDDLDDDELEGEWEEVDDDDEEEDDDEDEGDEEDDDDWDDDDEDEDDDWEDDEE